MVQCSGAIGRCLFRVWLRASLSRSCSPEGPAPAPVLACALVRAAVPFHWSPWMWIRPRAPRPRAASAAAGRAAGWMRPSGRPSVALGCRLCGHQLPLGPKLPGLLSRLRPPRQGATCPWPWLLAVATLLLPLARKGAGGPALGAGPPPPLRPGPPRRRRLAPLARCWEAPHWSGGSSGGHREAPATPCCRCLHARGGLRHH